jgi:hypothetical protein
MKKLLIAAVALTLCACGEEAPKPVAVPVKPEPEVAAPAPTPKPEAKAPEAPKPDPNKELAARVKRALEDAKLIGIDATASDGKVTLWGTTATEGERNRAATIAGKIDGVKSVDNQLKIVKGS